MVDGSWTALLGPSHQLAVRMRIMRIIVYRACVHMYRMRIANALRRRRGLALSLTLARACAAKGYCSRSVGRFVRRFVRRRFVRRFVRRFFLSNRGCCRYQTWICGYVQRALGTARVWNVVVKEQRVYGGRLKFTLMCTFLVKAESGGCQTWICG